MASAELQDEDEPTFEMMRRADTLGVFQIESRAQMSMLPRMKPRNFYDIAIQVAIVRPGPIQGDMVHPYLKRREGRETVTYPNAALRAVLEKTLGVPLFQEQAMQVAIVGAGFTPGEADQLRRAMATFKMTGGVGRFHEKLVSGMRANGIDQDFAERLVKQIEGFGSYGFPESHAASFAKIAYASSWMKCHHPDVFCAALLNAQPMGFYAPAQIVRDARAHGVEVRPVCVMESGWDTMMEGDRRGPPRGGYAGPLHGHRGQCAWHGDLRARRRDDGAGGARGAGEPFGAGGGRGGGGPTGRRPRGARGAGAAAGARGGSGPRAFRRGGRLGGRCSGLDQGSPEGQQGSQ